MFSYSTRLRLGAAHCSVEFLSLFQDQRVLHVVWQKFLIMLINVRRSTYCNCQNDGSKNMRQWGLRMKTKFKSLWLSGAVFPIPEKFEFLTFHICQVQLQGAVNPSNVLKNFWNQNHLIKHFFINFEKRVCLKRSSCRSRS